MTRPRLNPERRAQFDAMVALAHGRMTPAPPMAVALREALAEIDALRAERVAWERAHSVEFAKVAQRLIRTEDDRDAATAHLRALVEQDHEIDGEDHCVRAWRAAAAWLAGRPSPSRPCPKCHGAHGARPACPEDVGCGGPAEACGLPGCDECGGASEKGAGG